MYVKIIFTLELVFLHNIKVFLGKQQAEEVIRSLKAVNTNLEGKLELRINHRKRLFNVCHRCFIL